MFNILSLHRDTFLNGCAAYRYWLPHHMMSAHGINAVDIHMDKAVEHKVDIQKFDIIVFERIFVEKKLAKVGPKVLLNIDDNAMVVSGKMTSTIRKMMKSIDAVTVSTPKLKEAFDKKFDKPVYICPNLMQVELFDLTKKAPNKPPMFGFAGGGSHAEDWKVAKDIIYDIMHENPEWHFVSIGYAPDYMFDIQKAFPSRVAIQNHYVQYLDYLHVLKQIDVRLSPLDPAHGFNYYKSAIAALEMMASKGISIAQDMIPYSDVVTDGVNGFLASDPESWYQKTSHVLKNYESIHHNISENGYRYVLDNHDLKKNISVWIDAYQDILRRGN